MKLQRILRPGIVQNIQNQKVTLLLNPRDMKSACAEKGCNACTHSLNPTTLKMKTTKDNIAKGDTVVVSTVVLNEALGAFLAFIVPIIISVTYFLLVTTIFHWENESPVTVVSTLVVLFLGFGAPVLVDKILQRISPPVIESIERKNEEA